MLAAMSAGLVIYLLFLYRFRRFVELEQVRSRIATDLHDDIGSGPSQIAILSELARRDIGRVDGRPDEVARPNCRRFTRIGGFDE
jgi:Histidine kinase